MFNQTDKQLFLNQIKNESLERNKSRPISQDKVKIAVFNTVNAYGNIFKTSEHIEEKYGIDLHSFNIDQLGEFFTLRSPSSKVSARTIGRIVTKYIDWAIEDNISIYKNVEDNPLRLSQEYFNQFTPEESTQYLSVSEVKEVVDYLVNDQDSVIVALLFNGVQGKEASEIRNLTVDDVSVEDKTLEVKDDKYIDKYGNYPDKAYRIVDLSNDKLNTFKMISRAHEDSEYIKKNNEMEYNPQIKDVVELPLASETPYIIKTGKTQKMHYGSKASQYTIYNRLEMIRSLEGLHEYAHKLNTKNIVRSGMIFEAKCLLDKEGGELDNDKIERVCKKYNVTNHWAVRDFINMEVISSLYNK